MDYLQSSKLSSRKAKLKIIYSGFLKKSTLVILNRLHESKKVISIMFWLLILIASISTTFALITQDVLKYLEFETNTNIQIVNDLPMRFPTVTICNVNSKRNYSLDEILVSCFFYKSNCTKDYFDVYMDTTYGFCYQFNRNSNIKLFEPGKFNGFRVELFVDKFDGNYSHDGFRIFVHNSSIRPNENEGVDVAMGFQTNLVLDKHVYNRLAKPYSNCFNDINQIKSNQYLEEIIKSSYSYRQKDCLDLCTKNTTIYVSMSCFSYCPLECYSELYSITTSVTNYPSRNYVNNRLIDNKIIKNVFPDIRVVELDKLKDHLTSFYVYYEDLSYKLYTQKEAKIFVDVLANAASILSLFLGFTILTIFDLIVLIIESFLAIFKSQSSISQQVN